MSEQNKQLARRVVNEIWNKGLFDVAKEFVADDFFIHATTLQDEIKGRDGALQHVAALRAAFPDFTATIDAQVAEGDRVVTQWTARGTHLGEFQGMPPTGKSIRVTGVDIDRVVNGQIVECWAGMDELGLLQQLGAIPALAPS